MAIQAAGGNDFVNLSYSPYFITPSASASANTAALKQAATDNRKSTTQAGKWLYLPGNSSHYPFNATLITSPCRIRGDGMGSTVFDVAGGTSEFLVLQAFRARSAASDTNKQALSVQLNQGDTVLTGIASTSTWSAGDWISVYVTVGTIPGSTSGAFMGEWVRIKSVDSATQVTTWGPLEETYTLAQTCYASKVGTFWQGCAIEGLTVYNSSPLSGAANSNHIVFRGLENARFSEIESVNSDAAGIMIDTCHDFEGSCWARDLADDNTNSRWGYGVLVWNGCQNGSITLHVNRARHGFTTGAELTGIPRHITIRGSVRENTGTCFDTHAEGKGIIFENCHASNTSPTGFSTDESSAFDLRASNTLIHGGEAFQCRGWAVQSESFSTDAEIDGLRINTQYDHSLNSGNGIDLKGARSVVRNCNIMTPSPSGGNMICVQMEGDGQTVVNNVFRRTTGTGSGSPVSATAGATNGVVANNVSHGYGATFISGTTTGIHNGAAGDNNISVT